tara:strand:- start:196 stop:1041 length:846 start_codon:yes stop_codon:yes gene_type:complete
MSEYLPVAKTFKLYIDGSFPRSESGRTFPVHDSSGLLLANVALSSRKDLRNAIRAARSAQEGWSDRSAYNRGQILYRVAEMLESRRSEFVELLCHTGLTKRAANKEVEKSIDRWVWYAGWADKIHHVLGSVNAVNGPYFNFSVPEPTGVVGLVVPESPAFLSFASRLPPVIVSGNTAVVVAGGSSSLLALTLAEVLETSDFPPGVVNVLTGDQDEIVPWLVSHLDVNALDLTGLNSEIDSDVIVGAADGVKRVVFGEIDRESPYSIADFLEIKTVWHPIGK